MDQISPGSIQPNGAQPDTPFDAALSELLRAWQVWDDVRASGGQVPLRERTAAFVALDDARTWVGAFDGAGRQPGWAESGSWRRTPI